MKVEYVARKTTLNDQVRQLAEKKLAKIRKYFNDILDIRVEVEQEVRILTSSRRANTRT